MINKKEIFFQNDKEFIKSLTDYVLEMYDENSPLLEPIKKLLALSHSPAKGFETYLVKQEITKTGNYLHTTLQGIIAKYEKKVGEAINKIDQFIRQSVDPKKIEDLNGKLPKYLKKEFGMGNEDANKITKNVTQFVKNLHDPEKTFTKPNSTRHKPNI